MGHFEKHSNGRFHKHHQTQSEWIRLQMQLTLYSVFGCETSGLFKLVVLIPSIGAVWEHFQLQTVSAGEHPDRLYGKGLATVWEAIQWLELKPLQMKLWQLLYSKFDHFGMQVLCKHSTLKLILGSQIDHSGTHKSTI